MEVRTDLSFLVVVLYSGEVPYCLESCSRSELGVPASCHHERDWKAAHELGSWKEIWLQACRLIVEEGFVSKFHNLVPLVSLRQFVVGEP